MTHRHWCSHRGHYWNCSGSATRLLETEPSPCFCNDHGVLMEDGDHSTCSMEILPCPQHRDEQLRMMGYDAGIAVFSARKDTERFWFLIDAEGNLVYGRCLWCAAVFEDPAQERAHTENGMAACDAFQRLKDKTSVPPLLLALFDDADSSGDDENEK